MVDDPPPAFILDDFITRDSFHIIYLKRRDDGSRFLYVHTDYLQYLQYLNIIWNRIRLKYRAIVHMKSLELESNYINGKLSEQESLELRNVNIQSFKMRSFIECDIEAFIIFTRRFLDKVSRLIELLITLAPGSLY